ncbi:MAG: deoxyribodipyrimidine photo-lyase [Saprospiraceae bacterium]|nr:deoxyribodipyrimidine photo-lyase [Saprospiraceae bacterium]
MNPPVSIFWFRRDLRLEDNVGLYHALTSEHPVIPLFIFDTNILGHLQEKNDARITFNYDTILRLKSTLRRQGSDLIVRYGSPESVWQHLITTYQIETVYVNHDFEAYAIQRDAMVKDMMSKHNIKMLTYKDHVIFEKSEIVKDDGTPYTVFTPYKRKWLSKLTESEDQSESSVYLQSVQTEHYFDHFYKFTSVKGVPSLYEMGFERAEIEIPTVNINSSILITYDKTRDFPALDGTSRLGIHLRFGTISIRELTRLAISLNPIYLNELIWRDFYAMILSYFPYVQFSAFRPEYDHIEWRNNEKEFQLWCEGKTGYPIVDAGMRELSATGFMHNRVRMITASFLTKHLLIDWRWGEAWFAQKLLDFDLASNNGGWQWAAGCGTDASPYFRIFSPDAQTEKFDKARIYIKKWVPEYGTSSYVLPIVDHKDARIRCLEVYRRGLRR